MACHKNRLKFWWKNDPFRVIKYNKFEVSLINYGLISWQLGSFDVNVSGNKSGYCTVSIYAISRVSR